MDQWETELLGRRQVHKVSRLVLLQNRNKYEPIALIPSIIELNGTVSVLALEVS